MAILSAGKFPGMGFPITTGTLRADALAGLLGAVLSLPQGIAFGTLAGLPPEYGIYTAVVPCIVAALFGSSHHVVSGPTNANSLALFAALSPLAIPGSAQYIAFALAVTALVGLMQFAVGAFKLGWVADFIAPAVLIGFTSGAAILIGLYAVPDLLGLTLEAGGGVIGLLSKLAEHLGQINASACVVGATTLLVSAAVAKLSRRLPYMLIGIMSGFAAAELLARWPSLPQVARIGDIPSVLPPFSVPWIEPSMLPQFISIAGALSIVALGQSVSIAKAIAQRSGQHLDVDREFVGQGLSNIAGSFFSSYVSCGSLNRSLPNYLAGAKTPLAAVLSSVFLVALAFVSRPLLERLPMPAIGALLIYIAYGLVDVRGFRRLARFHRAEFGVAVATFGGMLFLPFQQAIIIGSALSLLLYLNRTAHPAVRTLTPDPSTPRRTFRPIEDLGGAGQECPQLKLVRIEGSVYFGAAGYVTRRLHDMRDAGRQRHMLVMVKSMNFIDLAGADVWEHELVARRKIGGDLYFHQPRADVRALWRRTGFEERLGRDNVFASKADALAAIYPKLDRDICAGCRLRLFQECSISIPSGGRREAGADASAPPPANPPRPA
ncbi:SulP family inorganic anion transporter [Xanthobacter sp. KR7-225]|uniref:SulP family inorganic anion transporter n=1 Tax=Xanthobacter sp. KR7-225 TaxID=3156613 RepID=UPI0032B390F5